MIFGTVYFVGAGPGHPGLITYRGVECLQRADVVFYDYLANAQILSHAHPAAELICLGRHRRADIWSQDAINEALVARAKAGDVVVRLKGGDPMIFGRATEELEAVSEAGIPFEIVPGVTTASAAGAYLGVTITSRDQASAVALVTGQERTGRVDSHLDYHSLANFPGTLVIYMGVSTAAHWSSQLLEAGKAPETPVLIVRRCSWPDQFSVACTLTDVTKHLTPDRKIPPPVIVIVGPAAHRRRDFDWYGKLPLLGKRIVVTRPEHQSAGISRRLIELGADVIVQPAIEIRDPVDWQPVDDVIRRLSDFDTLVFSSANGVHHWMRRILGMQLDARALAHTQLAAIGSRTAEALHEYTLRADVVPDTYRAEALAESLATDAQGKRFLLLRASRGREVLAEQLTAAGGLVTQVVVYESRDITELSAEVRRTLEEGVDWITVTSSAIARSGAHLLRDFLPQARIASISPITSHTLSECGIKVSAEAKDFTADGVIAAILSHEDLAREGRPTIQSLEG